MRSLWTGADEAKWLGWLDEPWRMREDVDLLLQFAESVAGEVDDVVLLGMGGSSLAPEVIRRTFGKDRFHVLDTTHPQAIRDLEAKLDLARTLFVSASKSGTTLETRSHTDYFCGQGGATVGGDHRPRLGAGGARAEARLPRRRSPASRRSAAATRRSRRSGWFRRR